jgi:hypothetical protein
MQGLRESLHDKDLLLANDGSVMVRATVVWLVSTPLSNASTF